MNLRETPKAFLILLLLILSSCGQELGLKEATLSGPPKGEDQNSESSRGAHEATVCPSIYEPVCAQPPMPDCPSGRSCAQVMPNPKTYSNECERAKARAGLISQGRCSDSSF